MTMRAWLVTGAGDPRRFTSVGNATTFVCNVRPGTRPKHLKVRFAPTSTVLSPYTPGEVVFERKVPVLVAGEPSDLKFERERERGTGRFVHDGQWDRLCVCGHPLGHHTAAAEQGMRPCIECDFTAGCDCDCMKFRPQRRRSIAVMRARARRGVIVAAADYLEGAVERGEPFIKELVDAGASPEEIRDAIGYVAATLRTRASGRQVR